MPGKTIEAFLDHGTVERTVDEDVDEARAGRWPTSAPPASTSTAVTDQLEDEGIDSFVKSFESLLAGVEAKREALAEASRLARSRPVDRSMRPDGNSP